MRAILKLNPRVGIYAHPNGRVGPFKEGNLAALSSRLSEDANKRRLAGYLKAVEGKKKLWRDEVKTTPYQLAKKAKRKRARLSMTVAREAREIQELARKGADAVMKRMIELASSSLNEAAAIAAGQVVLDRAYGKANQTNITATLDANGKTTDVSAKELDSRIEQTLKRVEELTGGKAKAKPSQERPVDLRKLNRDPDGSPLN
jgi:hypothetical protein